MLAKRIIVRIPQSEDSGLRKREEFCTQTSAVGKLKVFRVYRLLEMVLINC